MKIVRFFTQKGGSEVEVCRVWADGETLTGKGSDIWLDDLRKWFESSGETVEQYLESLHLRFDGNFLYAGRYEEEEQLK